MNEAMHFISEITKLVSLIIIAPYSAKAIQRLLLFENIKNAKVSQASVLEDGDNTFLRNNT
jgi:hypothetical protein